MSPDKGFTEAFWEGQLRYYCTAIFPNGRPCEYDTYDLDAMYEHMRKHAPRIRREASPIVDAEGRSYMKEYEVPAEIPAEYRNMRFKKD